MTQNGERTLPNNPFYDEHKRDFEQQVIYKVIRAGGLVKFLRSYRDSHLSEYGTSQLSLQWFHKQFPDFPVRLCSTIFSGRNGPWTELATNFKNAEVVEHFFSVLELFRIRYEKQTLGVVLNLDRVTFVMHNHSPVLEAPGRRIVRSIGRKQITFVFEEFEQFLKCVGTGWAKSIKRESSHDDV
jgi:hypothetical protein